MIVFRHCDPDVPFLWETDQQPAGRWHRLGDGPVHYFSRTPDASWAEFLRHEEIRDVEDLQGVARSLWAVEVPERDFAEPDLPVDVMVGGMDSYAACQAEGARLRDLGADAIRAPSAAVDDATGSGFRVDGGLVRGPALEEEVLVVFGPAPDVVGWSAVHAGRPRGDLLERVRHFW